MASYSPMYNHNDNWPNRAKKPYNFPVGGYEIR